MNDQIDNWLDVALADLAAADARAEVNSQVEAAVLCAWDAQQTTGGAGGRERERPAHGSLKAAAWVLVPAGVAIVVAVASLVDHPPTAPDRSPSPVETADPSDLLTVAPAPLAPLDEFPRPHRTARRIS